MLERVFRALNENVGSFPIDDLAVRRAGVAEHHPDHVRASPFSVGANHRCAGATVDLSLLPWWQLESSQRQGVRIAKLGNVPLDARELVFELVLVDQVLMDAFGRQA